MVQVFKIVFCDCGNGQSTCVNLNLRSIGGFAEGDDVGAIVAVGLDGGYEDMRTVFADALSKVVFVEQIVAYQIQMKCITL